MDNWWLITHTPVCREDILLSKSNFTTKEYVCFTFFTGKDWRQCYRILCYLYQGNKEYPLNCDKTEQFKESHWWDDKIPLWNEFSLYTRTTHAMHFARRCWWMYHLSVSLKTHHWGRGFYEIQRHQDKMKTSMKNDYFESCFSL